MRTTQGRAFLTTMVVFLLSLLVLGMLLQAMVGSYLTGNTFSKLDSDAYALAELVFAHHANGSLDGVQIRITLALAGKISESDIFVFDAEGQCLHYSATTAQTYQQLTLKPAMMQRIGGSEGCVHMTGVLDQAYSQRCYISGYAVRNDDSDVVGYVLVSRPVAETKAVLQRISTFFSLGAVSVMVISMLAMTLFYRRQSRPLQEMAKKAKAFGHGDLDARVRINGDESPDVEELAISFNNMASSLQKSEYSRQEFVANVSHELKTPMTTIGGYIDGILDGTIPPEKQEYYLKIVSDETKRLSRLVRSMLDISQLQGEGGIPAEKLSRFDVEECAGQMLITFEKKIIDKNIRVDVDMPDCPLYTVAQQDYISQVIYNLLDNAVKFCPDGGTLRLRLRESDNKILVSVGNDGETVPAQELSLLFDRFHKIDKSRTENRDGWGLGLYIVKTIVGLHGEDISVTSLDGFTEFTFTLPLME